MGKVKKRRNPPPSAMSATVLDCGGRGGVHRSWQNFPLHLTYYCFEPETLEISTLTRRAPSMSNELLDYNVVGSALDAKNGRRILNVYESADLSSFFELDADATYRWKHVKLKKRVRVPCITIDAFSKKCGVSCDFLSIDAQGATLLILKGAQRALKTGIFGIRCEVEFKALYKNQPLFGDIAAYLAKRGFVLVRIETCGSGAFGISSDMTRFSVSPGDALPTGADAIFVNARLVARSLERKTPAALRALFRLVFFCMHNGCGYWGLEVLERIRAAGLWQRLVTAVPSAAMALLAEQVAVSLSIRRENVNAGLEPAAAFRSVFRAPMPRPSRDDGMLALANTKLRKVYAV